VAGYNDTVESHIDATYGAGAVKAVWDEVQRRRKAAYDAWVAEQSTPTLSPQRQAVPNQQNGKR
jgi:hypothetical protein